MCLEPTRFPHSYLRVYYKRNGKPYFRLRKSLTPRDDSRLEVIVDKNTPRGLLVNLVPAESGKKNGLRTYLYTPPRCEGYRQVAEHYNPGPGNDLSFTYTYSTGITRTETSSKTTSYGLGVLLGAANGIVGAAVGGVFSQSWKYERSISTTELEKHQVNDSVPPGYKKIVWQKVATYGMYEWRSSSFIPCQYFIN